MTFYFPRHQQLGLTGLLRTAYQGSDRALSDTALMGWLRRSKRIST
jgi:hypothetical protein